MLKIVVSKKSDVAYFCINGELLSTYFDRNEVLTGVPAATGSGGFCGTNDGGSFVDCYAWGSVTEHVVAFATNWYDPGEPLTYHSAKSNAGNFVGVSLSGTHDNCYGIETATSYDTGDIEYYTSKLDGTPVLSGFASINIDQYTSATDSYWDVTVSGSAESTLASGQATSWMQEQDNYEDSGWDFDDVWEMDEISAQPDYLPYDDYYYDAEAETYKDRWGSDLTWDGTWGSIWTANPVWCTRDMMKNPRYGLGKFVRNEYLNDDACVELAKYCDEMVPAGVTGELDSDVTEKRFRMDMVIDSTGKAADVMQFMANVYRGFQFYSLGTIDLGIDKPESTSQIFGMGNIVKGSYSGGWLSWKQSYNDIRIRYLDREHDFEQDMVGYSRREAGDSLRPKDYNLFGVVRRSQALREAHYLYNASNIIGRTIAFKAGIDGIVAKAGKKIGFSHDVPQWGFSGRVVRSSPSDVTLDTSLDLTGGETYFIRVQHKHDTIETVQLSDFAEDKSSSNFSLLESFNSDAESFDKFALGTVTSITKPFRIMKLTRKSSDEVEITGVEYHSDVFSSQAFKKPGSYYSILNMDTPQVGSLSLHERLVVEPDGTIKSVLDVYWEEPATKNVVLRSYSGAKIYVKSENSSDSWMYEGMTAGTHYSIQKSADTEATYSIKVVAFTNDGYEANLQDAPSDTITLYGKTAAPEDVTGFDVVQYGETLKFSWDAVSDVDVSYYRIVRGSTYDSGTLIAEVDATKYETFVDSSGSQNFWIVAVDTSGNISDNPSLDTLSVNPSGYFASSLLFDFWSTGLDGDKTSGMSIEPNLLYSASYTRKAITLSTAKTWEELEDEGKAWYEAQADSDLLLDRGFAQTAQTFTMIDPVVLPVSFTFEVIVDVDYVSNGEGSVVLQISTSLNGSDWTAYENISGLYTARYVKYRLVIQDSGGDYNVKVYGVTVTHAALDRTVARGQDVSIDIGGNTEEYGFDFAEPPSIITSIVNGVSGTVIIDSKTVSDFNVHVEDYTGTLVGTAEIDWLAEGYLE